MRCLLWLASNLEAQFPNKTHDNNYFVPTSLNHSPAARKREGVALSVGASVRWRFGADRAGTLWCSYVERSDRI